MGFFCHPPEQAEDAMRMVEWLVMGQVRVPESKPGNSPVAEHLALALIALVLGLAAWIIFRASARRNSEREESRGSHAAAAGKRLRR